MSPLPAHRFDTQHPDWPFCCKPGCFAEEECPSEELDCPAEAWLATVLDSMEDPAVSPAHHAEAKAELERQRAARAESLDVSSSQPAPPWWEGLPVLGLCAEEIEVGKGKGGRPCGSKVYRAQHGKVYCTEGHAGAYVVQGPFPPDETSRVVIRRDDGKVVAHADNEPAPEHYKGRVEGVTTATEYAIGVDFGAKDEAHYVVAEVRLERAEGDSEHQCTTLRPFYGLRSKWMGEHRCTECTAIWRQTLRILRRG